MGHSKSNCGRYLINYAAVALLFLPALPCASQTTVKAQPENPFSGDLKKYPGLLTELSHLAGALKNDVQFPPLSTQSHLLAHLPAATTYYAAFPNYGETAHHTLETLRREVQASAVLRDWWQHGELSLAGPKLEVFLAKFSEVSQYLGNELVVSGATGGMNGPGAEGRTWRFLPEGRRAG